MGRRARARAVYRRPRLRGVRGLPHLGRRQYQNVTVKSGGENYGIDINQGYFAFQYGITEKWAADLNIGYTTRGLAQVRLERERPIHHRPDGLVFRRALPDLQRTKQTNLPWMPTLTFRAGAVMPGTYDQDFAYAPGLRSAAIVPEVLVRKHFGWPGLGAYSDALYRWNTHHRQRPIHRRRRAVPADQRLGTRRRLPASANPLRRRHHLRPQRPRQIVYPRESRENNDSFEAGFSYTTSKRQSVTASTPAPSWTATTPTVSSGSAARLTSRSAESTESELRAVAPIGAM